MSRPLPHAWPKALRIALPVLVLIGISGFIFLHRAELGGFVHALRSGRWPWLLAAAGFEGLYFLNQSFCFSRAFRLTGTRIPVLSVVPVLLGAQTMSVIVPSEFLADQSLFFLFARRHGQSPTRVSLGTSLAEVAELFAFMAVLAVGFVALVIDRSVQPYEVVAGSILSLLALLMAGTSAFLVWKPEAVEGLLSGVEGLWNRVSHRVAPALRLPQDWAAQVSQRLTESITTARQDPKGLAALLSLALLGHLLRIGCLLAVGQAFGLAVTPWEGTTAYAVGTLVWIASPIPGGIGLVEGAYSLALVSLGLTGAGATTLALAYRGITFWLLLLMGIPALRVVSSRDAVGPQERTSPANESEGVRS